MLQLQSNSLLSREKSFHSNYVVSFNKFNRLAKPYETQCYDYKELKTRSECLHECYIEWYDKMGYNCTPNFGYFVRNNKSLLNIDINPNHMHLCEEFTSFESASKEAKDYCYSRCPNACHEQLLIIDSQEVGFNNLQFSIRFKKNYIVGYNYSPHMTFFDYILACVNLIGLLSGMSITDIGKLLTDALRYVSNKVRKAIEEFVKYIIQSDNCSVNHFTQSKAIVIKCLKVSRIFFIRRIYYNEC